MFLCGVVALLGTSSCRPRWLRTHRDPHASASQVLGLKACATTAWLLYSFHSISLMNNVEQDFEHLFVILILVYEVPTQDFWLLLGCLFFSLKFFINFMLHIVLLTLLIAMPVSVFLLLWLTVWGYSLLWLRGHGSMRLVITLCVQSDTKRDEGWCTIHFLLLAQSMGWCIHI